MVYDSLRQKFIYDTPYDEDEFPLVREDKIDTTEDTYFISASKLYSFEEKSFTMLISSLKEKYKNVVIVNDFTFKTSNPNLINGVKCHILAFVYLFQKHKFLCKIKNA